MGGRVERARAEAEISVRIFLVRIQERNYGNLVKCTAEEILRRVEGTA